MKHYHCTVICFDGFQEDKIHYINPTAVSLIGFTSEEEAVERAKNLVRRNNYQLQSMFQCNTCKFQENLTDTISKLHE